MSVVQRACAVVFWSGVAVIAVFVLGGSAYGGWVAGDEYGWSVGGIALAAVVWAAELVVVAAVVSSAIDEIVGRRTVGGEPDPAESLKKIARRSIAACGSANRPRP